MPSPIAMGHQKVNIHDKNNKLICINVKTKTRIIVDDWCNADYLSADCLGTDKRTVTIERRETFLLRLQPRKMMLLWKMRASLVLRTMGVLYSEVWHKIKMLYSMMMACLLLQVHLYMTKRRKQIL